MSPVRRPLLLPALAATLVATALVGALGGTAWPGQLFWNGNGVTYPDAPVLGDGPGYAPPSPASAASRLDVCGNGICDYASQEWNRCEQDCGPPCFWTQTCPTSSAPAAACGDGVCQAAGTCLGLGCPAEPEDACSCPADCPAGPGSEAACACRAFADRDGACDAVGPGRCDEEHRVCCTDACRLTACANGRDDDEDAEFWELFGASGVDGEDYGCLEPHPDDPLVLVYRPERDNERDRYNDLDIPEAGLELLDAGAQVAALPAEPSPRRGFFAAFIGRLMGHHLDHDPESTRPRWDADWRRKAREIAAAGNIPVTIFYTVITRNALDQPTVNLDYNFVSTDGTRTERMWGITTPGEAKPLTPPPIRSRPNIRTGAYDAVVLECRAACLNVLPTINPPPGNNRSTDGIRFREVRLEWCVTDCICGSRGAALDAIQQQLDDDRQAAVDAVAAAGLATDAEVAAARDQIQAAAAAHQAELDRARKEVQDTDGCYQKCMTTGLPDRNVCGTHDPDCCRAACVGGICIPPRAPDTSAYQAAAAAVQPAGGGGGGGAPGAGGGESADGEAAPPDAAATDESAASSEDAAGDAGGGPGGGGGTADRPGERSASSDAPSSPASVTSSVASAPPATSRSSPGPLGTSSSSRGASSARPAATTSASSAALPRSSAASRSLAPASSAAARGPSSPPPPTVVYSAPRSSLAASLPAAISTSTPPRYYLEPLATPRRRPTAVLAARAVCGDGLVDPAAGEECDDGNGRDFDGCSPACLWERGRCGDGVVQALLDEQCEPSIHDRHLPYGCGPDCRFRSSLCGDGVVNPGEQCDEGPTNSAAPDAFCRADCSRARCGDGIVDPVREACDDGNRVAGDGCDDACRRETRAAVPLPARVFEFPRPRDVPSSLPAPPSTVVHAIPAALPATAATGPAALAFMAAGAAAGTAWVRRRR